MVKQEIAKKNWAYTLCKTDRGYVLSVLCGGVAMYDVNVLLSEQEAKLVLQSPAELDRLAADINHQPSIYRARVVDL